MSSGRSDPEETQPGLAGLRATVARYARRFHGKSSRRDDAIAGLNVTIANVPDGLANGVLVGVNPVFGLYATMVGPLAGGLLSSTQLMVISTTAAASLTAGQALAGVPRETGLFIMVVLAGVIQIVLGVARLGRLMQYVSYSVTTGFLAGIAVLLVLSQLPTITAVEVSGANRVVQTIDLLEKVGSVHLQSLGIAAITILLALVLPRTPLKGFGRLLAVVVPSLIVFWTGWAVSTVADLGEIPGEIPRPDIPAFAVAFDVLTGALALAVVALVQGAGVSQSVPNPDGKHANTSRDFIAQGVANVVSGVFRGLPVGGSASTTALNVMSGARSRWASVFAGVWMIVIVVSAPALVGHVAMPALGAILILAGLGSLRWPEIMAVLSTRWEARIAAMATFLAMLTVPIQAAVGMGVVLSILLFVRESATTVRIVELIPRADGLFEEREPPATLPTGRVTVLHAYGSLFYAAAHTFAAALPRPPRHERAAVVLRLRGHAEVGTTLIDVLERYAGDLQRAGGRLYLAGISGDSAEWLSRSAKLNAADVHIYEATPVLGESMRRAAADAAEWLQQTRRSEDV